MRLRVTGAVYLWLSVLIFAASNSVARLLSDLGAENPIDGRNPISFCNLFVAGNVCAVIALVTVYRKHLTREHFRSLSRRDWANLIGLALLTSVVGPWLFFTALENTLVTNVVLVAQIEPPLGLLLGWLFFREQINIWGMVGAAVCVIGVALSVLLQPSRSGFTLGKGELCAAGAAATFALSTILAKPQLERTALGIVSVVRNVVGTVVFFVVAIIWYGPVHFADLTAPVLWKWMLVYGGVIIVAGQILWFRGLKAAQSIDVTLATSAAPIAGILAAFIILGEQPRAAHYIGGGILVLGIVIGLLGGNRARLATKPTNPDSAAAALQAEGNAGFKGV